MSVKMVVDFRRKPSRARMLEVQKERAAQLERRDKQQIRSFFPSDIVTFRNGVRVN